MPRHFPDLIEAFCEYRTPSEAPEVAHRWTALWAVAGALRRNVWYEAGGFEWTPNFYIVLVGPPGVIQKSTTSSHGARLLKKVPSVIFGPDSATWHGMLPRFNLAEAVSPTSEGLLKVSPLSMAISELGSFLKLTQEGLDAVLIDMWDGVVRELPWTHTTQTHGDKTVWNGLLNLHGCTTLGWVRESVPPSALETGLVSRILFVYADKKRDLISIPKRHPSWVPESKLTFRKRLAEDLCDVAKLRGPFELSDEAYAWQDAWYREVWAGRPAHMASERFDVYRSRKQSHVFKTAMALAAARNEHPVLTLKTFQDAVKLVTDVEHGVVRIFEVIGGPAEAQNAREISAVVAEWYERTKNPLSFGGLLRLLGTLMTQEDLNAAIRRAESLGQVKQVPGAGYVPANAGVE